MDEGDWVKGLCQLAPSQSEYGEFFSKIKKILSRTSSVRVVASVRKAATANGFGRSENIRVSIRHDVDKQHTTLYCICSDRLCNSPIVGDHWVLKKEHFCVHSKKYCTYYLIHSYSPFFHYYAYTVTYIHGNWYGNRIASYRGSVLLAPVDGWEATSRRRNPLARSCSALQDQQISPPHQR